MIPLSVVLKSRAPQIIFGALEKDIFVRFGCFGGRLCKGHVASHLWLPEQCRVKGCEQVYALATAPLMLMIYPLTFCQIPSQLTNG